MSRPNECDHKWRRGLWAVKCPNDPEGHDPDYPAGNVPLEYCGDCGIVRVPGEFLKGDDISYRFSGV